MGSIGNLNDPRLPYNYTTRENGTVDPDDKRARFQWVSEVAYKNLHRIVSRGYDTTELVEQGYGVADMIFIDFQARIPLIEEQKMLNYVMIMALEDGLSAPAIMSRIVAKSNAILTQAVGASILSFGKSYSAYAAFGNMLKKYVDKAEKEGKTLKEMAEVLVNECKNDEILGVSDLMLDDPAAKRMLDRAEKLNVAGKHIGFMKEVVKIAKESSEGDVDIDMLGAIGATMMDLGFSPESTWAVLAVTRAFAAGAHFCEEIEREPLGKLGQSLTPKDYYDGPEDRSVPPLYESREASHSGLCSTPEELKENIEKKKELKGSGWGIEEEIHVPKRLDSGEK